MTLGGQVSSGGVAVVDSDVLGELIARAAASPRRRMHRNLHASHDDACQRVLNAIHMDSYIRPHRHAADPKLETLVAVAGSFALMCFQCDGTFAKAVRFGTSSETVLVEIEPHVWHTVLALEPNSVLLEVKAGPFDACVAKELASWAPEECSYGAADYLTHLQRIIDR